MPFMPKDPERPLNSYFQIRLNREQEEDVWKACAELERGTLAEWMRYWLNEVVKREYRKTIHGHWVRKGAQ